MKKPLKKLTLSWPSNVPETQFSKKFIQGMLDRVAQGFFTYGSVVEMGHTKDYLANVKRRIKEYEKTHNTEFLIDAANFCMLTFICPNDPRAFFKATSEAESPGSVERHTGRIVHNQHDGFSDRRLHHRRDIHKREGD
jgi:hypothetical protein